MTICPLAFVKAMTERWQPKDTASNALKQSWAQQAETFNQHIAGENTHPWSVLHPPTGTGKSQGLALYCSMLPEALHPGVLIVVRMTVDATKLAEEINALAQTSVALAVHTDSKHPLEHIYASPVLIVTHKAYELATQSPQWESINTWKSGQRKLTVIDERLSIIKYDQVHLDELRQLRGHLPFTELYSHTAEVAALDKVIQRLEALTEVRKNIRLSAEDWGCPLSTTFDGLRKLLKGLPLDSLVLHTASSEERSRMAKRHIKTLTQLEAIIQDWSLYERKGTFHTLTTAKVIVPRTLMNAVIMDATAEFEPFYSLLGDTVRFIKPPTNIRNYANVTLYASKGHKVGKHSMSETIKYDASKFIAGLSKHMSSNDKLLICTHKACKPYLEGYAENIAVANWGAIDGKNDWRDYNIVALYGLSYLDHILPEVSVIALQQWTKQSFSETEYQDAIEKLYWGHVAVTVIQAINRVQCRTPIDMQGNCAPTDIYIMLPKREQANDITQSIALAMPGIQSKEWFSHVAKKGLRRSDYEKPLVTYLSSLGHGQHLTQLVRKSLSIPQRTFEKLIAKCKDKSSVLHSELETLGCSYAAEVGRGAKSCFVMN